MSPVIAKEIPQRNYVKGKKKKITRKDILALPISLNCTSVYDGLVDDAKTSQEYTRIPTEEIIVQLYRENGWKVIGCGQQQARRNTKKYNSNPIYKAQVDKRQRMAKHYVLLQCGIPGDGRRVLIINGHRGNTAVKMYCGYISEDSNIYGVQFKELLHYVSIKHTGDSLKDLSKITKDFADTVENVIPLLDGTFNQTLTQREFENQILHIAEIAKKQYIKGQDMIDHFYKTKQEVWGYTYRNLLRFCTDCMVNHFVRNRTTISVDALYKHASLGLQIRTYVLALIHQQTMK